MQCKGSFARDVGGYASFVVCMSTFWRFYLQCGKPCAPPVAGVVPGSGLIWGIDPGFY